MTAIPLVDLQAQHRGIESELGEGFARLLATSSFILGKEVLGFEEAFARFSGTKHCVGVGNGTDALELGLRSLGVGRGDQVLVPANSFVASALAVVRAGATPVLVDCDPLYHLLDPQDLEKRITKKTKAIMPVHLYGQLAPMERLQEIARQAGMVVVEDAAQSQGAKRNARAAGSFGVVAGTSFYPSKNLGALGDGGAVLTDSDELAGKVRRLRNYGGDVQYQHPEMGFNSRLDALQAMVLSVKLKHLLRWNRQRQEAARRYHELLEGLSGVTRPETMPGNEHVWHLYVVRVPRRDQVLRRMQQARIGAGVHYPVPIHLQGAFAHLGHRRGDFPAAEKAADEVLSLPIYPGITLAQQERVVAELRRAVS